MLRIEGECQDHGQDARTYGRAGIEFSEFSPKRTIIALKINAYSTANTDQAAECPRSWAESKVSDGRHRGDFSIVG